MDVTSPLNYKLIRSARRSISLQITSEGELVVRAPHKAPEKYIRTLIDEKRNWIISKQKEILAKVVKVELNDGSKVLFLGKEYPLKFDNLEKFIIKFKDNCFYIAEEYAKDIKKYLEVWYRNNARKLLTHRLNTLCQKHGFNVKNVKLSNASQRWGSCSSRGNINLNWRLILAPVEVIDYVIIHELAHTRELNHSDKFWKIVADIMPDYKKHRKWLKDNGNKIEFK